MNAPSRLSASRQALIRESGYHVGMKWLPTIAFPLVLCGCAGKPVPPDSQRIVGEWVVMDFQSPNTTEDRGQRRKHAIVTEGTWSQQFMGETFEDFEYTLDPTKTPKQIDLAQTNPAGKRLTVRGIYELTHDEIGDRLRVCFGSSPVVK